MPETSSAAAAALAHRTERVDGVVAQAYRNWLAGAFPRGVALVAVGGYGRRELFPHSDVDLMIVVDKEPQADEERQALSAFLRTLWDNGLRLSQSVRTPAECARFDTANVELSVSLLDRRFLIGDSGLFEALNERAKKLVRGQREALLRSLCEMARTRHGKFNDTIYHLEPNIKECPGGFRDLQLIHWLRTVREAPAEPASELDDAFEFLADIRIRLHNRAGRDNNLLTFDVQEEMSPDPAGWMREYFRHAREINRAALREIETAEHLTEGGLMRSFRDWRTRLSNAEFTVSRDRVFLRSPQQLASDPSLLLRAFEFVARHGVRLSVEAERRIHEHIPYFEEYFAAERAVWPQLKTILSLPNAALALRAMHDTGVLHAVLPAWENIECLVVRDFYHRYTVDEHTLVTIEYLEELRATREPTRRRFAELMQETAEVAPLYLALLFHDTGKSDGMEGHAQASSRLASVVLSRIGVPQEERDLVLFLIERHLDLSAVMNSRDLSDPATAVDLARRVETLEKLKYLTLLTYADVSAVNPEAMTPWRLEQLWRTYLVGHRELTRELQTERIHSEPSDKDKQFLEGFPTRYLRTHNAETIERHRRLADKARYSGVATELTRHDGTWDLVVVTEDRPGLFAKLAGFLAAFGMNIVKAEAFSNASGLVLDTFAFEDRMRTLELNQAEKDRLQSTLAKVVLEKEDVARLLRGRARPKPPSKSAAIPPTVAFDNDASDSATLVEIVAHDRPGLLYDLANTFSKAGCSIDVVLIDTEVHKAIDVFYVTRSGGKLGPAEQSSLKGQLLAVCGQ
jgi:[protein-PII] uridylyltransferase